MIKIIQEYHIMLYIYKYIYIYIYIYIKAIVGNINVVKHVCSHNCLISDVSVTFIDKTDPSDPLKREDCWRSTLKTVAHFGLYVEESV